MVDIPKVVSIFVVFGITFFFGVTPVWLLKVLSGKLKNMSNMRRYISRMNCFAGGVFLGTSILHLIQESMEKVAESIPEVTYPISGVLIGAGFFIVLGLEHIIGLVSKGNDSPFIDHGHDHGHGHYSHDSKMEGKLGKNNKVFTIEDGHTNNKEQLPPLSYKKIAETTFATDDTSTQQDDETAGASTSVSKEASTSVSKEASTSVSKEAEAALAAIDITGDGRSITTKRIRTLILVIALSIHMIFEGMAIGLQDSDSSTWTLMAAISIHKAIVVFSVGIKMKEVIEGNIKIILYILYLSAVSPTGIAVGLIISITGSGNGPDHNSTCVAVFGNCSTDISSESKVSSAQDISSGILQSLASGTFLYVTFFEILQNELSHGYSLLKVFLTLLGFGVMAALKVLDKE